jgi:hypothetical protein
MENENKEEGEVGNFQFFSFPFMNRNKEKLKILTFEEVLSKLRLLSPPKKKSVANLLLHLHF